MEYILIMYINDIISKLNQNVIRIGNCDYYVKSKVEDELNNLANECVRWSVDDFKQQAILNKGEDWKEWYDEELFEEALHAMTSKHDASIGINWDVVDCYLEEYCWRKKESIGQTTYKKTK